MERWLPLLHDCTRILSLRNTFLNGQAFGWRALADGATYVGVIGSHPVALRQRGSAVEFCLRNAVFASSEKAPPAPITAEEARLRDALNDLFQFPPPTPAGGGAGSAKGSCPSLEALYALWGAADDRMRVICEAIPGNRILRQDPWECLVSFICSSNNNISRISLMLRRLRVSYGESLLATGSEVPLMGGRGGAGGAHSAASAPTAAIVGPPPAAIVAAAAAVPAPPKKRRRSDGASGSAPAPSTVLAAAPAAAAAAPLSKVAAVGGAGAANDHLVEEEDVAAEGGGGAEDLPDVDGSLFAFPTVERMALVDEESLRRLGFGYRAKFIVKTAQQVLALGGLPWLLNLRSSGSAVEVRKALMQLSGVGPKVADCVALFSLDQASAIPCDVHVWNIAVRYLDPTLANVKSLTPAVYERVGDLFRGRYGAHAGWAHSLLFAAELPIFAALLPPALREEMSQVRAAEKAAKVAKKQEAATAAAAAAAVAAATGTADAATGAGALPSEAAAVGASGTKGVGKVGGRKAKPAAAAAASAAAASGAGGSVSKRGKKDGGVPPPAASVAVVAVPSPTSAVAPAILAPKPKRGGAKDRK